MNTIEDAKKIDWILKVLQKKLKDSPAIRIRTEILSLDEEIPEGGMLMGYFDIKNIPLLWSEIAWLQPSNLLTIILHVSEKEIAVVVMESHEVTKENPAKMGLKGIWYSMDTFRNVFLSELYNSILASEVEDVFAVHAKLIKIILEKADK